MTEKEIEMTTDLLSKNALKSDDVLVQLPCDENGDEAVRLTSEVIQAIVKLEQYAIMSSHRIGEFRVG